MKRINVMPEDGMVLVEFDDRFGVTMHPDDATRVASAILSVATKLKEDAEAGPVLRLVPKDAG